MKEIPDFQISPPAGHEKKIAHRPACDQLEPQVNPETQKVDWGVTLPDGTFYILGTRQAMPTARAHSSLDSAGLCKVGGQKIPIVPPGQAVAGTRQIVNNIPMTNSGISTIAIIGVLSVVAIAVIAILVTRKDKDLQAFVGEEK